MEGVCVHFPNREGRARSALARREVERNACTSTPREAQEQLSAWMGKCDTNERSTLRAGGGTGPSCIIVDISIVVVGGGDVGIFSSSKRAQRAVLANLENLESKLCSSSVEAPYPARAPDPSSPVASALVTEAHPTRFQRAADWAKGGTGADQ